MMHQTSTPPFLQRVLKWNSGFSLLSGLVLVLAATPLASLMAPQLDTVPRSVVSDVSAFHWSRGRGFCCAAMAFCHPSNASPWAGVAGCLFGCRLGCLAAWRYCSSQDIILP